MIVWPIVLLPILAITLRVQSQLDPNGFLDIDCGLPANTSYTTGDNLTFLSDDQFIDTGSSYNISNPTILRQYQTVRSFPTGTRNCYTIRSLKVGYKYLIRAGFYYGNYDQKKSTPIFDIYLGVNFWCTVYPFYNPYPEIIALATNDQFQICLVNTNQGTPFISILQLRQWTSRMYAISNATQSLILVQRSNEGASQRQFVSFPADPRDRWWWNISEPSFWTEVSTSFAVESNPDFEVPSVVMQTGITTSSSREPLSIVGRINRNGFASYYSILYFAEIQNTTKNGGRVFDVYSRGNLVCSGIAPDWLQSRPCVIISTGYDEYNVSLVATASSTLPPLLNAFETYLIAPVSQLSTSAADVSVINSIKEAYKVKKGWSGDPCFPSNFTWDGIGCSTNLINVTQITSLNLSSSGLTGTLSNNFGSLNALVTLDLSSNDLTGDLPNSLDNLVNLTYLDIRGNKLSTALPLGLHTKLKNGNLTYRFDNNTASASGSAGSSKKKVTLAIAVAVPLVVIAVLITTFLVRKKMYKQSDVQRPTEPNVGVEGRLDFENRRYSYNDLVSFTNRFENHIGTGGFGNVYLGFLDDGTQVAVKMRSHSSSQGVKEFLAEAKNLARVHHKNLVSLIGYCLDGDYMALVYEYMQEGTLQDKLRDNARPLSWKQRIRIAYESALGLEYLHKACNPPLIHRDVKTSNILLNENLVAKIADFGLSRVLNSTAGGHVSTVVVGTPGYLDPEYYSLNQLSVKSDVFSFGVVLLEIITGKLPINPGPEGSHLKQWVNKKLSRGDIESIVDPKIQGQYDLNSVWKVTELARKCTENSSAQRPTMRMVVAELKESLDLEISTEGNRGKSTANYNPNNYSRNENFVSDVSQNSFTEMAYMRSMGGPAPEAR